MLHMHVYEHFDGNIFKCMFMKQLFCIFRSNLIEICSNASVYDKPPLVHIMALRQAGGE